MGNIIEILEKFFNATQKVETGQPFVLVVKDYVQFIQKTPGFNKIIKKLKKEKGVLVKKIIYYEKKSLAELKSSKKEIAKIANRNLTSTEIEISVKHLEGYEKKKITRDGRKSDHYNDYLCEIANALLKKGHGNLLKKFIATKDDEHFGIMRYFVFSKNLQIRQALDQELNELRQTALWGHWDYLECIYKIASDKGMPKILSGFDRFGTAKVYFDITKELGFSVRDVVKIKSELYHDEINANRKLKLDKYKNYITRIHNYLIQNFNNKEKNKNEFEQKLELVYKNRTGLLSWKDKSIILEGQFKIIFDLLYETAGQNKPLIVKEKRADGSKVILDDIATKLGNKNLSVSDFEKKIKHIRNQIETLTKIENNHAFIYTIKNGYMLSLVPIKLLSKTK